MESMILKLTPEQADYLKRQLIDSRIDYLHGDEPADEMTRQIVAKMAVGKLDGIIEKLRGILGVFDSDLDANEIMSYLFGD